VLPDAQPLVPLGVRLLELEEIEANVPFLNIAEEIEVTVLLVEDDALDAVNDVKLIKVHLHLHVAIDPDSIGLAGYHEVVLGVILHKLGWLRVKGHLKLINSCNDLLHVVELKYLVPFGKQDGFWLSYVGFEIELHANSIENWDFFHYDTLKQLKLVVLHLVC
jgi:hypothetical protein